MLVYGDRQEQSEPRRCAEDINRRLGTIEHAVPGLVRHAALVGALLEGGRLLQGLADSDFDRHGCDRRTEATDELGAFLTALGGAVCQSWDSGFIETGPLPRLRPSHGWPEEVELKVPEGFAFYAVYPEAYAEAARRLRLTAPPRVIAIRSIGTALGAIVAAALDAPSAVTVRPFGEPTNREVAIDPALERDLLAGAAHYVIVDEGPGQSGSSFAAVAAWLQQHGVPGQRIAVLPSHAGAPGPAATEERKRWWQSVQREPAEFGEPWPALVERWCAPIIGQLDEAPLEVSGGAWRQVRYAREEDWPAAVPAWERRKFLVRAGGERLLVKFAGLGRIGEEKLAIARTLHEEALAPEPIGLVHGFLVERWCGDAAQLRAGDKPVEEIGRYIGVRAKLLPATRGTGASVDELLTMARRNIAVELGEAATAALEPWELRAPDLRRRIVRVRTDNKLDRHEWLRTAAGALIKADALDHHQAHDPIGCQDVAWDVAGAIVEFDLDQSESDQLIAAAEHAGGMSVDRELLAFCRIIYLAFRLGQARLGAAMDSSPSEQHRIGHSGDLYAVELQHLLESSHAATRPESLVG